MKVQAIEPNAETGPLLTGAQFSDAFSVTIDNATLDALAMTVISVGH